MTLTYSKYAKGFEEWIKTAEEILTPFYTAHPEVQQEYKTLEDFAVEVYMIIMVETEDFLKNKDDDDDKKESATTDDTEVFTVAIA